MFEFDELVYMPKEVCMETLNKFTEELDFDIIHISQILESHEAILDDMRYVCLDAVLSDLVDRYR